MYVTLKINLLAYELHLSLCPRHLPRSLQKYINIYYEP